MQLACREVLEGFWRLGVEHGAAGACAPNRRAETADPAHPGAWALGDRGAYTAERQIRDQLVMYVAAKFIGDRVAVGFSIGNLDRPCGFMFTWIDSVDLRETTPGVVGSRVVGPPTTGVETYE
jgi:hypothetical protein